MIANITTGKCGVTLTLLRVPGVSFDPRGAKRVIIIDREAGR